MSDFMPSYVYSDDDTHNVKGPKPRPAGTEQCDGCNGSGTYYGRGAVVNGKFVGYSGTCYRCQGKGYQLPKDRKRNGYYDRHVRRFTF
jgi:DnaJ-class molecular chaperone